MRETVKKAEEITQDMVDSLVSLENIADGEIMVPVDFRGAEFGEQSDPKATAVAFLQAEEYFDANKEGQSEEQRPKPMTVAQWKQTLDEHSEDEEEELSSVSSEIYCFPFLVCHWRSPVAEYRHLFSERSTQKLSKQIGPSASSSAIVISSPSTPIMPTVRF